MEQPQSPPTIEMEHPDILEIFDHQWEFCQEVFQELTENVKELYNYEATIQQLGQSLWQGLQCLSEIKLSGPLVKVQTEAEWEECELDNPKVTRVGFDVSQDKLRSHKMLENQTKWQLKWMRNTEGSLVIYRDSPRELCIDPTFCLCERRYS